MMRHLPTLLALTLSASFAEEVAPKLDLLRFSNGDQLHGRFAGMVEGGRISWERPDVNGPMDVSPAEVRQVVFNGGRPRQPVGSLSSVTLVDGDRIPGVLKSLDAKSVVIDTTFAGEVTLPRERVAMLAPSPLGGRLVYHGPYDGSEWLMTSTDSPEGVVAELPEGDDKPDPMKPGIWKFSGSAWYWQGTRPGIALVKREGMPDRAILKLDLAWKSRMSLALAFHADFKRPKAEEPAAGAKAAAKPLSADASSFPSIFGNSYVLQMSGNSVLLYRVGFDEEDKPILEAVRSNNYSARLGESDRVTIELRCSKQSGEIALFMNDEFVCQWNEMRDGSGYAGKGSGIGFMVQSMNSPLRISDIAMAEWNGMPDSARSLQVEEQDIVLLANGTDRFSGKVTAFKDGVMELQGRYGDFRFPLDDLAEIRFAKGHLAKPMEMSAGDMLIHMAPLGRITGKPVTGTDRQIRLLTPSAGELNVDLAPATILDFNPANSFLDDWDVQF